ncbi:MAG: ExeM/NucH family extracellular endonuclease [Aestuariibacter sp.]
MKKRLSLLTASIVAATQAQAVTVDYGWEDGATILGEYSASHIRYANSALQTRSGGYALQVEDFDPIDNGTPQSFVGWVNGLTDGDTVTVSFWVYDDSADRPAGRVWGHYTNDSSNIDAYAGSAGGNSTYTDGSGWQELSHTWTFDSNNSSRDGLVIEFRLYDSAAFTTGSVFIDDIQITASAGAITLPNGEVIDAGGSDGGDGGNGSGDNTAALFISEYIEGSSNNKAIEIYNAGTETIDLAATNTVLARYSNGSTTPSNITLQGSIAAGDVFVIAHSSAVADVLAVADQVTGSISHNGDDGYVLSQNGNVVDSFGQIGTDPGSAWGTGSFSTANNTLRRNADVTTGDTIIDDIFEPSTEWTGFGQDDFSDLGSYNGSSDGGDGGDNGGSTPLTCGSEYTAIYEVQGAGFATPLNGQDVQVEGIVTADFQDTLSGFFMQSADGEQDGDATTSEGVFVFTGNSPQTIALGQRVRVAATAGEFYDMTQLSSVSAVEICGTAGSLPTVTELQLPFANANAPEQVEGMMISFSELTVNDTYNLGRYGTVTLANGRRMIPTQVATPGAEANAIAAQNALNNVLLDDGSNQQNPAVVPYPSTGLSAENSLRIGDTASMAHGVMHYSYGEYRIQPVSDVAFVSSNPRQAYPELSAEGNLKVASFNVLNYFNTLNERGADTAEEFVRQEAKIVAALSALDADIIGLMEIENDGYATGSSINDLVTALNTAQPGVDWQYITPEVSQIGTDAIAVGLLYRASVVEPTGVARILDSSNSMLDEAGQPLFLDTKNRPALAQEFTLLENDQSLVVAVNHLKSKGSNCDSLGDPDLNDGQGNCNLTRTRAAQALSAWLNSEFEEKAVLVVGDLNAYAKEDPLTALATGGYAELFEHLGKEDAYSYVFRGESGQLDHALGNDLLLDAVVDVIEWHINTDEPRILDYNTEYKTAEQIDLWYAANPYRSSDHDPVVIALQLERPFDPNYTLVEVSGVSGLATKDQNLFERKQQKWLQRVDKITERVAKLVADIERLDPERHADRIAKKQAKMAQLQFKREIFSDLIDTIEGATSEGASLTVEVIRQIELSDKNEEAVLKRQARFEKRSSVERAIQLEAKAAELMARGKTEQAERKLKKAAELRAKAAVYAQLVEVLAASI